MMSVNRDPDYSTCLQQQANTLFALSHYAALCCTVLDFLLNEAALFKTCSRPSCHREVCRSSPITCSQLTSTVPAPRSHRTRHAALCCCCIQLCCLSI